MSRLEQLKKQYPEFNVTIFDIFDRMDVSKTYKYIPLFCKLFSQRINEPLQDLHFIQELDERLDRKKINFENLTSKQKYVFLLLSEQWNDKQFETCEQFMDMMERGLLENKDVTSYSSLEDMRAAITLSSLKEITKSLEKEVIKEYEDDNWIIVRPLTFLASSKYGASTRWCTTYQKEKNYFEKYWRTGILVYFINKKTGYKFAGFKSLDEKNEVSFWNAEDNRIDFLETNIDDYLFPIVRKTFRSEFTNKNLCTSELQEMVHQECIMEYEKLHMSTESIPVIAEPVAILQEIATRVMIEE